MFIKLTNATPDYKGTEILINTNTILSVNTGPIERTRQDGTVYTEIVTFVYCPPHGTWEVSETLEQFLEKVNGKKGFFK